MAQIPNDPKYVYADILIALAHCDDHVDGREREFLNGVFKDMDLDLKITDLMWETPRTLDVVEAILADVTDESFKRCLLKDCFLLAYADDMVVPEENKFIQHLCAMLNIDDEVEERIEKWVEDALDHNAEAQELFGHCA